MIRAPLANVWHHVKLHEFANFWTALKASDLVKGVSHEADVARWTFKDGTVLDVKQEEHSVRAGFLIENGSCWLTFGPLITDNQPLHHLQRDRRSA